jgi:hypothetical protein
MRRGGKVTTMRRRRMRGTFCALGLALAGVVLAQAGPQPASQKSGFGAVSGVVRDTGRAHHSRWLVSLFGPGTRQVVTDAAVAL